MCGLHQQICLSALWQIERRRLSFRSSKGLPAALPVYHDSYSVLNAITGWQTLTGNAESEVWLDFTADAAAGQAAYRAQEDVHVP